MYGHNIQRTGYDKKVYLVNEPYGIAFMDPEVSKPHDKYGIHTCGKCDLKESFMHNKYL